MLDMRYIACTVFQTSSFSSQGVPMMSVRFRQKVFCTKLHPKLAGHCDQIADVPHRDQPASPALLARSLPFRYSGPVHVPPLRHGADTAKSGDDCLCWFHNRGKVAITATTGKALCSEIGHRTQIHDPVEWCHYVRRNEI